MVTGAPPRLSALETGKKDAVGRVINKKAADSSKYTSSHKIECTIRNVRVDVKVLLRIKAARIREIGVLDLASPRRNDPAS